MIVKWLALAALVAAPVPASQDMVFINYPGVYLVDCDEGSGSAFEISNHKFFSVAHVTAMHNCKVAGKPITVTEQDGEHDFSQFTADVDGPKLRYSCEGFHAGEWTWATGYAKGLPFQTAIASYTTYAKNIEGFRVLVGNYAVIPGMSGGSFFNSRGEVIGTVNAYIPGTGISLSRDLRDTSVCK